MFAVACMCGGNVLLFIPHLIVYFLYRVIYYALLAPLDMYKWLPIGDTARACSIVCLAA